MDVGFGAAGGSAFTDQFVTSGPINLPAGRAMHDGYTAAVIIGLAARVAGRGATRNIALALGFAGTGSHAVGAASHPVPATPVRGTDWWMVNGGTTNLYVTPSGQVNLDRGGGYGDTSWPGNSYPGIIGGLYQYILGPTEPRSLLLSSPLPGRLDAEWYLVADEGGASVTGYRVQIATDAGFTQNVQGFDTAGRSISITGLTPGTYYVRVFARNAVTDAAGRYGPASAVGSVALKSGGHRWNGTTEVGTPVAVRWNGSAEVPLTVAVRWDGEQEVPLT